MIALFAAVALASSTSVPLAVSLDICRYASEEDLPDAEFLARKTSRGRFQARFDSRVIQYGLTQEQAAQVGSFCDGYVMGQVKQLGTTNQH
jgi:hypothetical protein